MKYVSQPVRNILTDVCVYVNARLCNSRTHTHKYKQTMARKYACARALDVLCNQADSDDGLEIYNVRHEHPVEKKWALYRCVDTRQS